MHPAKEGFSALPFFDEFDLSTVDILLISQYVEFPCPYIPKATGSEAKRELRLYMYIMKSSMQSNVIHLFSLSIPCLPTLNPLDNLPIHLFLLVHSTPEVLS
jgi:hypothetical protein